MTNRKMFILLGLVAVIGAASAWWVLITPGNPLTSLFRRQISDTRARIVIGPYPAERDFRLLKQNHVGRVVPLLDPAIPYEATLLEREHDPAAAEARFLSALRQVPDNADALGGLGLTSYRAARRGEAVSRLEAAPTLTPDNQELRDVLKRARASR